MNNSNQLTGTAEAVGVFQSSENHSKMQKNT